MASKGGDHLDDSVFNRRKLKDGVMSHPVRLQVQCLLYIIGHISFNAVGTGLPPNSLGLLPRFIRIKLLLLLPAVDVAKLEGTPVTNGISMNEIWETICKERLPLHKKHSIHDKFGGTISTPEDLQELGVESVSWKEAYFNIVFLLYQLEYCDLYECGCVYNHFFPDLFYSMDTFYSDPFSSEVYQCFNEESSLSIHEVYRCAHKCPRLTPGRYYNIYPDPSSPQSQASEDMPVLQLVEELVNCNVSLKHLCVSDAHFEQIRPYLDDVAFLDCFYKLLQSVEALSILDLLKQDVGMHEFLRELLNIIFMQNKCSIKFARVHDDIFDAVFPFLIASPQCNLKHLELIVTNESSLTHTGIKECEMHPSLGDNLTNAGSGSITGQASQVLPIFSNVLKRHQNIQKFALHIDCWDSFQSEDNVIQCISDLMFRPVFKELVFGNFRFSQRVSPDIVLCLFHKFFSSPCPVSMTLIRLACPEFPVNTDPFTINHDQAAGKSLKLNNCDFPNVSILFPHCLVFKSFVIEDLNFCIIPSFFAKIESITVEQFSLTCDCITTVNVAAISSLIDIVNAQQWSLTVSLNDDIVDEFSSLLSKFSCLRHFCLHNDSSLYLDKLVTVIESIFLSLSPMHMSQFELSFDGFFISDGLASAMFKSWESHCTVKLKKISAKDGLASLEPVVKAIFLDMANDVE